jgi:ABC-2 type transport system permease protein
MINGALLKATFKENYKLIATIGTVLVFYLFMIMYMYDPTMSDAMMIYIETLPAELIKAMNFNMAEPTFTGFIVGYYYGFLVILFPMILIMMLSYRLMNKMVDRGSMAILLSTPNTRINIALTQAVFSFFSATFLIVLIVLFALITSQGFNYDLDVVRFLHVNALTWGYMIAISGITFMVSCLFVEAKHALAFIIGIPMFFFLVQMLTQVNDRLSWLKYVTLLSFYQPNDVVLQEPFLPPTIILLSVGLTGYVIGILIFKQKDLPI